MYSFPNLESVHCPMSSSNCCFLMCIQVTQEADKVVWHSHLFKNFPLFFVIHTVKDFSVANEAEAAVFLETHAFSMIQPVLAIWSVSSASLKPTLYTWPFSVHVLLKPNLKDFEHYFASMWNECNCMVTWTFFDIVFLWDWNENWSFPVLWPLLSLPNLLMHWLQHFNSIIF